MLATSVKDEYTPEEFITFVCSNNNDFANYSSDEECKNVTIPDGSIAVSNCNNIKTAVREGHRLFHTRLKNKLNGLNPGCYHIEPKNGDDKILIFRPFF